MPFSIAKYKDEVWCHVVPMTACHLLLGRPWLYDRDVHHQGRANKYTLKRDEHDFTLLPLEPEKRRKKSDIGAIGFLNAEEKALILKTHPTIILKELEDDPLPRSPIPRVVQNLIDEFPMVFSEILPSGLPPIRTTRHEINFHSDVVIPNKAAYKMNPKEHEVLQKEVDSLLKQGFIRESTSPCVVPAFVVLKKKDK